jgi:hypothetical protein
MNFPPFLQVWKRLAASFWSNRFAFSMVLALFLTAVGPNAGAQTQKERNAKKPVLEESARETGWAAVPQTTANPKQILIQKLLWHKLLPASKALEYNLTNF